ncbi:MAG: maleylpyruvate isomerase family mycothiol-dependent enzyme [Actinomycetales bacterium]|nr:maleylpyruvate isomerase family mycothiol-dependent enzyme [Actinomycetales bacterium]
MTARLADAELRAMMRDARAALAEDLAGLTQDQWHQQSLCGEWDVEHVVAHLTAGASTGQWAWIRSIVAAGFRPAVHNARRLREHLGATPAQTLENFRAIIDSTTTPSKHSIAYLGEIVVHGQDVRQPLGLPGAPPVEALTPVAGFYAARDFAVNSATAARGVRLQASDGPFAAGEGPTAEGPTLALIMVMAGRAAYLEHLDGPGVAVLEERIGPRSPSSDT